MFEKLNTSTYLIQVIANSVLSGKCNVFALFENFKYPESE